MASLFRDDCMLFMRNLCDSSIDMVLTDIPYDGVNRVSNGLRNLDKGKADEMTFDLKEFLVEVDRVCKGTIIIFCAKNQLSDIFTYFENNKGGTVRQLVWEKSNPSPMNGQHIYLSGIENAIWFKKKGATFNAHCKNTVFKFPNGRSKLHPTEKNHDLLKQLILENSDEGQIIFDPCMGSGSHLLVAKSLGRAILGTEIDEDYFSIAKDRIESIEPIRCDEGRDECMPEKSTLTE